MCNFSTLIFLQQIIIKPTNNNNCMFADKQKKIMHNNFQIEMDGNGHERTLFRCIFICFLEYYSIHDNKFIIFMMKNATGCFKLIFETVKTQWK